MGASQRTCAPKTEREVIFARCLSLSRSLFLSHPLSRPGRDLAYWAHFAARGRMLPTAARSAPLWQQAVRRAILPRGLTEGCFSGASGDLFGLLGACLCNFLRSAPRCSSSLPSVQASRRKLRLQAPSGEGFVLAVHQPAWRCPGRLRACAVGSQCPTSESAPHPNKRHEDAETCESSRHLKRCRATRNCLEIFHPPRGSGRIDARTDVIPKTPDAVPS